MLPFLSSVIIAIFDQRLVKFNPFTESNCFALVTNLSRMAIPIIIDWSSNRDRLNADFDDTLYSQLIIRYLSANSREHVLSSWPH